jgi:hypothetical protein
MTIAYDTAVRDALYSFHDKGLVCRHLRIGNPCVLKSTTMNAEVSVLIELEGRTYRLDIRAFRGE